MKDYRLTIKVRNNRLLKAIEAAGGTPGGKWCEENGLSYARVNDLVNMTASPMRVNGMLRPEAARLCEILGKIPEDLWSNEQLHPLERNFSEMEMDHAQVVALLPPEQQSYLQDFSGIENEQTTALVDRALSTLRSADRDVIRMRFHEGMTLDECGKRLGVTTERVRQIEMRALRCLRHPSRVGILIDAVDGIDVAERARFKEAAAEYFIERGVVCRK